MGQQIYSLGLAVGERYTLRRRVQRQFIKERKRTQEMRFVFVEIVGADVVRE